MSFGATVYRVLLASPSDVQEERKLLPQVIHRWNDQHAFEYGTVLLPIAWETHTRPELGDRPQAIINRQIVDDADVLIGVFWTRIGTDTGEAESGTIEEIKRFRQAGKPVLVYFSSVPVPPNDLDAEQYRRLTQFRGDIEREGLVETYGSIHELEEKLARQLPTTVRGLAGKKKGLGTPSAVVVNSSASAQEPSTYSAELTMWFKLEGMQRGAHGEVVRHDYILYVRFRNGGTKTFRHWHVDLFIPSVLRRPGIGYGHEVETNKDRERLHLRFTQDAMGEELLYPDADAEFTVPYMVDDKIHRTQYEVFSKNICSRAFVDDELVAVREEIVRKLQNF